MVIKPSLLAEFQVWVKVTDVNPSYSIDDSDAQNQMMAILNAILDAGIKPVKVAINPSGSIGLYFTSFLDASEADKAVDNVFGLLWLLDHPEDQDPADEFEP